MHPDKLRDTRFQQARDAAREFRESTTAIEAVDIAKGMTDELEVDVGYPTAVELTEDNVVVRFKRDLFDVCVVVSWTT